MHRLYIFTDIHKNKSDTRNSYLYEIVKDLNFVFTLLLSRN
jgi:hypothetical protein